MTENEQNIIKSMREDGCGYVTIAKAIASTKDKVVAYCRKNGLTGQKADNSRVEVKKGLCLQCNAPILQKKGRKEKKFCCNDCRTKWWNAHPEKVNRKAIYSFQCASCGRDFTAYGNAKRKYCSHSCYIKQRYQGGVVDEA